MEIGAFVFGLISAIGTLIGLFARTDKLLLEIRDLLREIRDLLHDRR